MGEPSDLPTGPVAERRVTSVLFGDLVSFTSLSEHRDPEEVRELLSHYFAECRTVIGRYGGNVEKFIGDAVMAVWGVPVAHEDDASRAVLAGLELVAAVAALGESVGASGLAMRVGVVTGEVAVTLGAVGEGMVAGDAVNTASRVQSTATPGTVWVDDATRALTSASIAYADEGAHELKGKAEAVRLFSALAVVGDMTTGGRADGLEARLAGRDRELRTLKELYHATEEARRPRLVVLDGDAGIGKSRLAWEFEKYVDGLSRQVRWHRGRCLSYGDGVAFWALSEAVRTRLGLVEGDVGDVVSQRLETRLEQIVPDERERDWLRPRLGVLVGAPGDTSYGREELFAAWTTFFERVGAEDPVVILIDDAEHADDALLDFLDHLLATATGAIFVLALARPPLLARRPDLGGRRANVIRLDTLDDAAMAELVDDLVVGLPEQARAAVVGQADGVPLFAVETVRALIDRDVIVPRDGRYVPATGVEIDLTAIGAPVSLHALIASRLDALTPTERRVVTDASVLGATFTRGGVLAVAQATGRAPEAELDDALTALYRKEILAIQRDPFSSSVGQYRFVQTIVRQVAYATQSRHDRKLRHLAAADHLASQNDEAGSLSVVVAQHLLDAVDSSASTDDDVDSLTERARSLVEAAARRALALGATAEALRLFTSALSQTTDPATRARLHEGAARAALAVGDHVTAIAQITQATRLYDELGEQAAAGRAVAALCDTLARHGDSREAIDVAEPRCRALEEAQPTSEVDEALSHLYSALTSAHSHQGHTGLAGDFARLAVQRAEGQADTARTARAIAQLGSVYMVEGAFATGQALLHGAADLARENGNMFELSLALNNLMVFSSSRSLERALSLREEATEAARRSGQLVMVNLTTLNPVVLLWTAGRLGEAIDSWREAGNSRIEPGPMAMYATLAVWLGEATGERLLSQDSEDERQNASLGNGQGSHWREAGRLTRARAANDRTAAIRIAQESLDPLLAVNGLDDDFVHLWPPMVLAAVEGGDAGAAERLLSAVTAAAPGRVTPLLAAWVPRFQGLVGILRGAPPEQIEAQLREGIHRLADFGAVGFAAQAEAEFADWLVQQGRSHEADQHYASAREAFERIGARGWLEQLDRHLAADAPADASADA